MNPRLATRAVPLAAGRIVSDSGSGGNLELSWPLAGSRAMNAGRAAAIIVAKEVRAEFRARELLNTTLIFAFVVVVIFSFAFDPTTRNPAGSARACSG